MVESILAFCLNHQGVAVLMGAPGSWTCNQGLMGHFVRDHQTLVTCSDKFCCVATSTINSVTLLKGDAGKEKSVKVQKEHTGHLTNLSHVGQIVICMGLKLELHKPAHLKEALRKRKFQGVFYVVSRLKI